ncbi:DUF3068 domain-containing protein [Nocardioides alcanivorans]|uniref:DUF3068 domain-containing protein n=1 Tax=Nocardioides alcanivorans TaxID=2897352 RepID=UPI001F1E002C|nr:DUF3068 domain-containing protein [Nocardioides alcanivorans]
MRGKTSQILIGVGIFLVVVAALLRFYAYDKLAVAPIDQNSVNVLVGPDANLFDTGSLSNITTDLTTTAKTVGLIKETENAPDGVVVWETSTSTRSTDGVVRSRSIERIAFDAHTGEAVNCCGEFQGDVEGANEEVKRDGLLVKFPFNTEKKTYEWWDADLGEAVPIRYVKEEDVEGLGTYKFTQTIEPTVTATQEVPASVIGEDAEGNVDAEMTYSNIRTLWVEPRTGVVIKRLEQQYNTIRYDGEDRVVTTDVDTQFDAKTIKENVDTYGSLSTMLFLLRTLLPLIFLILGVALLAWAVVRMRRSGGEHAEA